MVIYNSLPNDGVKFLNNKIYLKQSEEDMTPVVKSTSKIILINFSWLTYLQQPGNEKTTLHLTE